MTAPPPPPPAPAAPGAPAIGRQLHWGAPSPRPPHRLRDVEGVTWEHPDPDHLRRFIANRDARIAPPAGAG